MKMQAGAQVKLKRISDTKRGFVLLSGLLVALAAYFLLLDLYIVRELVFCVACAALLVLLAANLALLGILFHAAGRSFLQFVRQPKTRIAQQEEAHAEHRVGPLIASPTMSTAARTGRL